jgi:23S rRNA (cytidine1920-2'-O)/16S rRNA (cytidine1409-2'-O)-methyltransferase
VLTPGARFVGRGGVKLAGALDRFALEVAGLDVLDVGASTGGFTDALLRRGAHRVAALDVGRGQLDWTLRNDPRVRPLEGVNARRLEPGLLPFVPQLAVVDVSFISLRLVLPAVVSCLAADGEVVALVKPQFEVTRAAVGRGGIVRDERLHHEVLLRITEFAVARGWAVADVCASVLRGSDGNREFFLRLRPAGEGLGREARERRIGAALVEPESR